MPAGPGPLSEARRAALARALGVTRVARVTGLDRTGVEVASAIRPGAHVLQVTNGKGETAAGAAAGALMEAAELAGAERARADAWASTEELALRLGSGAVLSPRALDPEGGAPEWDAVRIAWRRGWALADGAPALVPAQAVHVPPAGGPSLGVALLRWTSNGMGAAPRLEDALLHALLEAVERDAVARALPEGFTRSALRARLLERARLARTAPRAAALAARIEGRGFGVHLLDLTTPARAGGRGAGLPCAAALLVDVEGGAVPVSAGYACRLTPDAALQAALLEAAQSRATEIHGAREDVAVGDRHAAAPLRALLGGVRAGRDPARMPRLAAGSARAAVAAVLARLRRAGFARAAAVPLDAPAGVHAVKVVVPGLLLSELL